MSGETFAQDGRGLSSLFDTRGGVWFAFALVALLLLNINNPALWAGAVVVGGLLLAAVPSLRPSVKTQIDRLDLIVIAVFYVAVVAAFRIAFTVFTTDNVTGLFLAFAVGLVIGVVGPIVYQTWMRGRNLRSLGIGTHNLPQTLAAGIVLAAVQFFVTLFGYALPAPVEWVPLLVMSLVVGLFEAVFFRGFIQNTLEASLGAVPAVIGAALLYAVYHVGYGMPFEEMWFLFGLGVVYAIIFRLTSNILVLWPLLTPLGAFFNNLRAGDISLPWQSILGFLDVAVLMGVALWLARRHLNKQSTNVSPQAKGQIGA